MAFYCKPPVITGEWRELFVPLERNFFRARQRDKIALLLEEFSTVQEEADRFFLFL